MSEDEFRLMATEDPPPAHLDPSYQKAPGAGAPVSAPAPTPDPQSSPTRQTPPEPAPQRPNDPDEAFGKGSGIDLVPVSRDMAKLKDQAKQGKLRLDEDTARMLLMDLVAIKDKVEKITAEAAELDVPLRLGANWVAETMSRRLHSVAEGDDSAAIRVLKQFAMVISDYEEAVRAAARRYYATEEELQAAMHAMERKVADEGSRL